MEKVILIWFFTCSYFDPLLLTTAVYWSYVFSELPLATPIPSSSASTGSSESNICYHGIFSNYIQVQTYWAVTTTWPPSIEIFFLWILTVNKWSFHNVQKALKQTEKYKSTNHKLLLLKKKLAPILITGLKRFFPHRQLREQKDLLQTSQISCLATIQPFLRRKGAGIGCKGGGARRDHTMWSFFKSLHRP